MAKKKCTDCWVAVFPDNNHLDNIYESQVLEEARIIKSRFDNWKVNPHALPRIVASLSLLEHFKRRTVNFDYCPNCGHKIDWDQYKEA